MFLSLSLKNPEHFKSDVIFHIIHLKVVVGLKLIEQLHFTNNRGQQQPISM